MYHNFVVTHPLPLILLPSESLVQILSYDMLCDMYKCSTKNISKFTSTPSPTLTTTTRTTDGFHLAKESIQLPPKIVLSAQIAMCVLTCMCVCKHCM